MNATGKRRLLALAKFLRGLPAERFDMREWVGKDWKGGADLSCGTTACALGWATTMPLFRKLGLRLVHTGSIGGGYPQVGDGYESGGRWEYARTGYHAAAFLFGITYEEAEYLFLPGSTRPGAPRETPKQVARRIEAFVGRAEASRG